MWPLIEENKQEIDKEEKNLELCNTCFFSKKIYFQRHESQ